MDWFLLEIPSMTLNNKEGAPVFKYLDRLKSQLRYEEAQGIHTFHMCACGRQGCRAGACSLCLKEQIKKEVSNG